MARPAAAVDELSVSLNYLWQRTGPSRVETTFLRDFTPVPWGNLSLRGRLGTSLSRLQTLDWAADFHLPLYDFLKPAIRIFNISQLANGTHHAGLLAYVKGATPSLYGVVFFLNLGWFERWVTLKNAFPVPFWGGTSYHEHELATAFGFRVDTLNPWAMELKVATYDDFDPHNLNEPFFQITLARAEKETASSWFVFYRNDLLLGFGRTGSWRVGVGYQVSFTPPFSTGS